MNAVMQFTKWLRTSNERFARFSGSQFSPHELPGGPPCEDKTAVRQATKICKGKDCRKRVVRMRQKYCSVCSKNRIREQKREHMRRKRGLDVESVADSPIGAEALTKTKMQGGYDDPQTAKIASNFSTQREAA
jgi:hypothetical protein